MMNFAEYQHMASRTMPKDLDVNSQAHLVNFALGLTGEGGEVADIIKKHVFHGHELDIEDLKKELGDVLWYVSCMCTLNDIHFEEVAELNIEKLSRRYAKGFSKEDSINRVE